MPPQMEVLAPIMGDYLGPLFHSTGASLGLDAMQRVIRTSVTMRDKSYSPSSRSWVVCVCVGVGVCVRVRVCLCVSVYICVSVYQ